MISTDIQQLERGFDIFNRVYFEGKLPIVAITIESAKCYAYITTSKVWKQNDNRLYQITLSAEYIDRDIHSVMASLLHEMCHLYALVNDIKDTSNRGVYHSKVFKNIAEARGLKIEYGKTIGWSITHATPELVQVIKDNGLYENIDHSRITKNAEGNRIKKPSSTRTYACPNPNCSCSVRSTRDWLLICGTCMETMVKIK